MALIVETISATSMAELRGARDAVTDADIVELRLDGVRDIDVVGALAGRRRPVIVTCRPVWEGGRFDGSEETRLRILRDAIVGGAEFVDVEWHAAWRPLVKQGRGQLVLSHHDFQSTPADVADLVRAMRAESPGLVKISVTAKHLADCLTLRDAVRGVRDCVAISMGPAGLVTRVWPEGFGSLWTYSGSSAPGQMPASRLARQFRVRATTAATTIYAITGSPLAHSASPAMHNAAFAAAGLDALYVPLETTEAAEALRVAEALGVRGLSVTAPLKEAFGGLVETASDVVRRTGAINTLRRTATGWEAENFDVAGFLAPLERRLPLVRGKDAVVLGAGGAARAVAVALKASGVRVAISARRAGEADRLAHELGVTAVAWPPGAGWSLLVNATPVGTWPDVDASPMPNGTITGALVYDLVYNPSETALVRAARSAGAETISGLEMLVAQARRQFAWWTGRDASPAAVERAAFEMVSTR